MSDVDTIESLRARRNGRQARPNVRYRDARESQDQYFAELQRRQAGMDTDRPKIAWWRRLQIWELGLLVLGAIGLCVAALVGR